MNHFTLESARLHSIPGRNVVNSQTFYFRACFHEGGGPQVGVVTCGGLPHLTCKRDPIRIRDYMDRRVTSPSWGHPPPCKQALVFYRPFLSKGYRPEARSYVIYPLVRCPRGINHITTS